MESIKLQFRFPCFIKRHISSRCEALAEIISPFAVCAVSVLALGRPAFFIQARFRCESYSTFRFGFGNSCSVCSSLPASLLCPNGTKLEIDLYYSTVVFGPVTEEWTFGFRPDFIDRSISHPSDSRPAKVVRPAEIGFLGPAVC
ncbi:hypothetical protein TSPI_02636 [Trichinella spiralis]|uniref:Uncharacterized protein n=1 Tax=Trichinella spiralis TaxID=6334 RepID=A0ABR3KLF1_TRISP